MVMVSKTRYILTTVKDAMKPSPSRVMKNEPRKLPYSKRYCVCVAYVLSLQESLKIFKL